MQWSFRRRGFSPCAVATMMMLLLPFFISSCSACFIHGDCGEAGSFPFCGVDEVLLAELPSSNWSLALMFSTFALDTTPRQRPAASAMQQGLKVVPISPVSLAAGTTAPLVLAIEDGHLAVGDSQGEWLRSSALVADGLWHHMRIIYDHTEGRVTLLVNGVFQHVGRAPSAVHVAVLGGPRGTGHGRPSLFVAGLDFSPASQEAASGALSAWGAISSAPSCFPSIPWLQQSRAYTAPDSEGARLLLLVLSDARPGSAHFRIAARQSWVQAGVRRGHVVRHFFCIGSEGVGDLAPPQLAAEAAAYADLLFVDAADDYVSLSQKVFSCFRAALELAPSFDFFIKTDHDVFLRLDRLHGELTAALRQHRADTSQHLYLWRGFAFHSIPPLRDLAEKNADVGATFMVFPPYTAGVGYVLSSQLLREVAALPAPAYTLNEDQALGLWVRQRESYGLARVAPFHDVRFQQADTCTEDQLAVHGNGPADLHRFHVNLVDGAPLCKGHSSQGACALCVECPLGRWPPLHFSWFACDALRGAGPIGFTTLEDLLGFEDLALKDFATARAAAAAVLQRVDAESCLWRSSETFTLFGAGVHANATALVPSENAPVAGIDLSCSNEAPSFCGAQQLFFHTPRGYACAPAPPRHSLAPLTANAAPCPRGALTVDVEWMFFSAMVDSSLACTLRGVSKEQREAYTAEQEPPTAIPRNGNAVAFCGVEVELLHADGSTTKVRSPFARGARRHLHYEVLHFPLRKPALCARVTILMPSNPLGVLGVYDVSLAALRALRVESMHIRGGMESKRGPATSLILLAACGLGFFILRSAVHRLQYARAQKSRSA